MRLVIVLVLLIGCNKAAKEVEDYKNKSKAIEAKLMLGRLAKSLKVYASANQAYPEATAALTPATPCCKGPDQKCAPDPAQWEAEPWKTLEFTVDDPFRFQYAIESTATSFTARAVGDLGCNGKLTTFTIRGTLDAAGVPQVDTSEIQSTTMPKP